MSGWGFPEWFMAIACSVGLLGEMFLHGRDRLQTKYDGWKALVFTAITVAVLHFGGFW